MKRRMEAAALAAVGLLGVVTALAQQGAIYGTVKLDSDREITGVIRWEQEEAYWVHHFNGRHGKPRDISFLDDDDQEKILDQQPGPQLQLDDGTVIEFVKWFSSGELRPTDFAIEFGAIDRLELKGSWVDVTLRDGTEFEAYGGSNDIETEIFVKSEDGTERELDWDEIDSIQFAETPAGHPQFVPQLYGRVKTRSGTLTGLVIWDNDERFATDKLDGDLATGEEVSIEFGEILSIISRGNSSVVVTRDGAERELFNSNDVDADNRGIVVVNPAFGRALIDWSVFEEVTYKQMPEDFLPARSFWTVKPLSGTVETHDGKRLSGKLIYDVDEGSTAESLDGRAEGIDYDIPLRLVARVEPHEDGSSTVTLVDGTTLKMTGDRDVSSSNNGILVDKAFLPWGEVKSISFE
ncbi:MAG: hypothetical protein R3200_02440 [Xanthomonadales bacterium]|nr:hypothetical protein [Xanthomonadales bacterium]